MTQYTDQQIRDAYLGQTYTDAKHGLVTITNFLPSHQVFTIIDKKGFRRPVSVKFTDWFLRLMPDGPIFPYSK